jgi:kynurenine formamidase
LVKAKIKGLGIDTASMDPGNSKMFYTHQIILGANLYGLENLDNLNQLPPIGTFLMIAPMKIKGGSGGPTRIFAKI